MAKIRILIVDDSSLVRLALRSIFESDPALEVIGEARDGQEGVEKTIRLRPNVVTMDLKMPVMGGLEAIQEIMEKAPTAIIVVSSLDVAVIVRALGVGAMDFVPLTGADETIAEEITEKVKIASKVRPLRHIRIQPFSWKSIGGFAPVSQKVVVVGVSTGGPQALQVIFSQLPRDFPASILVVQHMAAGFVGGLAEFLQGVSSLPIRIAKAGDAIAPGAVFFAPDGLNMGIDSDGKIFLKEDLSRKNFFIPSIDFLMESAAKQYQQDVIGVLLTGMGKDGVEGIGHVHRYGGITIAQDEESSVIFGMNKLAIEKGYIDNVVPLKQIHEEMIRAVGFVHKG